MRRVGDVVSGETAGLNEVIFWWFGFNLLSWLVLSPFGLFFMRVSAFKRKIWCLGGC